MFNYFEKFDLLSIEPRLYVQGQSRFQNLFGFVVTLINFSIVLGFGLCFFISFLKGKEINLVYTKRTQSFEPKLDLTNKIFFYQVANYDGALVDPRLILTIPTLWYINNEKSEVEILEESNCSMEKNLEEDHKNLLNFDISNYKCISRKNKADINLSITKSPFSSTYLNLYITMCKNTTSNGNHCYPKEVIEERLKNLNLYLNFYLESTSIDHYNQKNPISVSFYADQVSISPDFIYAYFYDWRTLYYQSDEGAIFSSIKEIVSFSIDSTIKRNEIYPKGAEFWAENSLSIFQFGIDAGYADQYKRTFPKFQNFLANFCGICNFLVKLSEGVAYIASNKMMYSFVVSKIPKKPKPCKGKRLLNLKKPNPSPSPFLNIQKENSHISVSQSCSMANIVVIRPNGKADSDTMKKSKKIEVSWSDSVIFNCFPKINTKKANHLRTVEQTYKNKLSIEYIFTLMAIVENVNSYLQDTSISEIGYNTSKIFWSDNRMSKVKNTSDGLFPKTLSDVNSIQ